MLISRHYKTGFRPAYLEIVLVVAALSALSVSIPCAADMYRYVDDEGDVNVTDRLENVPEKFWETVEVIEEEELPDAGDAFPKTEKELQEEKKPVNRAKKILREGIEGKGKWAASASAATLIIVVLLFRFVRRRVLRYLTILLVICCMALFLLFLHKPEMAGSAGEIFGKGLDAFIK
jgi:hypothetical protein